MGDEARYLRLLYRFSQDHGRDGGALQRLAQAGDTDQLQDKAHAIKGAAATLGAVRVQQEAAALEALCKTGGPKAALDRQIERLRQSLLEFSSAMAELPNPIPLEQKIHQTGKGGQALATTLDALAAALRAGNTTASTLCQEAKPLLVNAFGPLADRLDKEIQDFDYQQALETIEQMQSQQTRV